MRARSVRDGGREPVTDAPGSDPPRLGSVQCDNSANSHDAGQDRPSPTGQPQGHANQQGTGAHQPDSGGGSKIEDLGSTMPNPRTPSILRPSIPTLRSPPTPFSLT